MSNFLLLSLFFRAVFAVDAGCVWKDSKVADDFFPCNSTSAGGTCCLKGETCLESGLCLSAAKVTYRGACHNVWAPDTCVTVCEDISVNWANFDECPDGGYWCGTSDDTSCSSENGTLLDFDPGKPIKVLPMILETSSSTTTSSSTSSSRPSTTASNLSQIPTPSVPNPSTPTPSTPTPPNVPAGTGLSQGAVIGMGVGLGLLGLLLVVAAVFWIRRHRRQKQATSVQGDGHDSDLTATEDRGELGLMHQSKLFAQDQTMGAAELDAQRKISEVGTRGNAAELDAAPRYSSTEQR